MWQLVRQRWWIISLKLGDVWVVARLWNHGSLTTVPVSQKETKQVRKTEGLQTTENGWCFAFCTQARGALLPDGKLESELSLGHTEPFGSHSNEQFHRVGKKKQKKKLQNKEKLKLRKMKLDMKTTLQPYQTVLLWLLSPVLHNTE